MSAPDTATAPSRRGDALAIESSAPESTAFPLKRNHPAVPAATPLKLQTPDLLTAPSAAVAKVKPLVGDPGVNAPDARVTVPSSVPVAAASADAG